MVMVALLFAVIAVQRILELRLAKRHEAWARAQGAVEYGADHYWMFFPLHAGWLFAWPIEAILRGNALSSWWPLWLALFVMAQGLRYWAIYSLGPRWNTRILVFPGQPLVDRGPFRWVRHPNYVAVVTELVSVPLVVGSWVTAVVFSSLNLALLLGIRIPAEVEALRLATTEETPATASHRKATPKS